MKKRQRLHALSILHLLITLGLSASAYANGEAPHSIAEITVPNTAKPSFAFDIGYTENGHYFLADRNNKAVDMVDTHSNTIARQFQADFTGIGTSPSRSGPDGLVGIPGKHTLYVGDVNKVKVLDTATGVVRKTIPIGKSGYRTDEGCFDPRDHLVLMANPEDSPPFISFIDTDTQTVVAHLDFPGSTGLEACEYDPNTQRFLINNVGSAVNPGGEVDVIPARTVVERRPHIETVFPLGKCAPSGLALGPRNDVMVGCDPEAGDLLVSQILDRRNGRLVATVPVAGVDQIAYDAGSHRYFMPAPRMTKTGKAASAGFTPTMAIIDGYSRKIVAEVPIGKSAHSVAVDARSGRVYVPSQADDTAHPHDGKIAVYSTR